MIIRRFQEKKKYHMKSRIKSARGTIRPFPIIASSIEKADKPLMLSGLRKLVH